jgi:RNA-binding protein MEX3
MIFNSKFSLNCLQIKVPVKIVGLVVGSKGQTIKNIQQQTHTYIVTPSRDKEPVFEVTGLPENVQQCRRQIEAHIALRTGNMSNMMGNSINGGGGGANGNILCNNDETVAPDLLQCLYNKGLESLFNYLEPNAANDNMTGMNGGNNDCAQTSMSNNTLVNSLGMTNCDQFLTTNGATLASSTGSNCSSSSSSTSSKSAVMIRPELINIWKSLGESIDCDEGIGESPNIWTLPNSNSVNSVIGSRASPSTSASPTDSLLTGNSMKRECLVCGDKEVTAALVPCGHNLFCLDCANRICGPNGDHLCPVCNQIVIQAIRIIV